MNPILIGITFAASVLVWLMVAGLAYLWAVDGRIKKEQVVHALIAAFFAWTAAQIIKSIFPVVRPYQVSGELPLTIIPPLDGAFPSAHTAIIFAVAMTIWQHDRKIGKLYLIGAAIIGIARILANVHYPIDILGGVVLGAAISVVIDKVHFHIRS